MPCSSQPTPKLTQPVPLGDSITEITCWRALVWDQLQAAGLADKVQYVGSQNSNPQNCKPTTANWDQHHEGHSGWLAVDIANNYLTNWLKTTPADIVMFMLGTNDVFRGKSTNDIIAAYTKMVGIMRAANPKTKIIVRALFPLNPTRCHPLTGPRLTSSSPSPSAPTPTFRLSTRASPSGPRASTRPSRPSSSPTATPATRRPCCATACTPTSTATSSLRRASGRCSLTT